MVRHRLVTSSLLFLLFLIPAFGKIGNVTSQTKAAQITRKGDKILTEVDTPVEMRDLIETLKGRANIKFVDDTKVSVTEYSKLLIDEFVYNPEKKTGKLSLKAALGTIRYSSGKIAKNSRQNVKIKSPTASVSVRGTDFTMNVQEDGASSFLLLPSTDEAGNSYVGSIDVSTLGGTVTLDQAYEATTVVSAIAAPTPPQVIQQDGQKGPKKEKKQKDNNENKNPDQKKEGEKFEDIKIKRKESQIMNKFLKMEDGRYVFFSKDKDNMISLIVEDGSNVTVNYDNSGSIINAKFNSGNNVQFNIKQQ
jgi:hypothetical protein|tara:strand:- start:2468 stop:3385 length:918 start_codon:yes stop_codon:yes gene_type:complete